MRITPPIGIYHRMWGAALHDKATGVHRPLTATLLWLAPRDQSAVAGQTSGDQIIVSMDHCILDSPELNTIRMEISKATGVDPGSIHWTVSGHPFCKPVAARQQCKAAASACDHCLWNRLMHSGGTSGLF